MRRKIPTILALAMLAVALAACSCSPSAWLDSGWNHGKTTRFTAATANRQTVNYSSSLQWPKVIGTATADRPTVCYSSSTPWPKVVAVAAAACAKTKRVAVYLGSTHLQCRVASPDRAYFRCMPPGEVKTAGEKK